MGNIYEQLKKYDAAKQLYTKAREIQPDNPKVVEAFQKFHK